MADYIDRLRVLLVESDFDFCRMFIDVMNRIGSFAIDVVYQTGEIKAYVGECYYSVIIANKKLISADEIEYVFSHNVNPTRYPGGSEIILIGDDIDNDRMFRIGKSKPMFYLKKPLDLEFLKNIVLLINDRQALRRDLIVAENRPQTLEACVLNILKSAGVPTSMKGHRYLLVAIKEACIKPSLLDYITKLLYPAVAKICSSIPATVERGIRHVIEVAWNRGDIDLLNDIFGYTINPKRGKPTNSEFIAMIAEHIRLNYSELISKEDAENYAEIIG